MYFTGGVVEPEEAAWEDRDYVFLVIDPRKLCHMCVDIIRKGLVPDLGVSRRSVILPLG